MLNRITPLGYIANALKRIDYFNEDWDKGPTDDCRLFVEAPDGSLVELLALSEAVNNAENDVPLMLGHLRDLLPEEPKKAWEEAWRRFDEGRQSCTRISRNM